MIDYDCESAQAIDGNCTGLAPSGGPYIIDETAYQGTADTEHSFTEYVCTENSCVAVTMPEGATSTSEFGEGIVGCQANLVRGVRAEIIFVHTRTSLSIYFQLHHTMKNTLSNHIT